MVNANVGRPWTLEEDALLTAAVSVYGHDTERWKVIALLVPGRTNKACRKVSVSSPPALRLKSSLRVAALAAFALTNTQKDRLDA